MTTQEIQSKLIDHYSLAIERVKEAETYKEAWTIAVEMNVQLGICSCAKEKLDTNIYNSEWINKYNRLSGFSDYQFLANTKEEILSRLQLRLDILKKEYSLSIETIK